MNNKAQSIITSLLFLILFIGLVICAYHIYTINKELDTANAKITKCSIFLSEENVQSLKKEVDTSDWKKQGTDFFTIRFPQEWHWISFSGEVRGHDVHVISNDSHFNLKKYYEISIFSDIGPSPSIILKNKSDVIISDTVTATTNAGTPKDSIDAHVALAKSNYSKTTCKVPYDWHKVPLIASCTAIFDDENQRKTVYYIANEEHTIILSFNTTRKTTIDEEIFDKIAESVVFK